MPQLRSKTSIPTHLSRQSSSREQSHSLYSTPRSRSSSRGTSGHRGLKPNVYSQSAFNASSDHLHRTSAAAGGGTSHSSGVRRWDGNKRSKTTWDCLRKDPELWFPGGDCLVHFYEQGQSRRGPSLRLSLADIESSNCRPLLEISCSSPVPDSPSSSSSSSSSDGAYCSNPLGAGRYELYIPAPAHLSREEAFLYHLTTRNFFAWMFEKPLVGHRLGEALISLQERMDAFRPDMGENRDDILAYLDTQGYTDFRECPDHALAVLQFSENFECRDLWTEAFVHCAGMNDRLIDSSEFELVSRTSKALITRAHLEMDIRLDHVGRSLGNFLEDDLSGAYLGFPDEARGHLERFRSFLHSFYVQKHGYWPPARTNRGVASFPKSILRSMYFDFRCLYDYLVDPNSYSSQQGILDNDRPGDGGICALQNLTAFDRRYKFTPLPYLLPRVPESLLLLQGQKSTGLSRVFKNKHAKNERRIATLGALTSATNCNDMKVMECALVREYFRFEREWTIKEEEKVAAADGRKVRWILIYAILQNLISVTRAPREVRDTDGVSYPLCCQIAGTPPWKIGTIPQKVTESKLSIPTTPVDKAMEITPALDHFTFNYPVTPPHLQTPSAPRSRTVSISSLATIHCPQPLRKISGILTSSHGYGPSMELAESPCTPSDASDGNDSGWSAKEGSSDDGLSIMDHISMSGSASVNEDQEEKPATPTKDTLAKPATAKTEISYSCVKKAYSPDSFQARYSNPELDRYITS